MQTETLTPQELRGLLFDIERQEMTISELRKLLFGLDSETYKTPMRFNDMDTLINKLDKDTKGTRQ